MSHSDETMLKGIGVSPGIVISSARVLRSDISQISTRVISSDKIEIELERFRSALQETRKQILHIRKQVADVLDEEHARIFDAHMLVVEDQLLIDDVEKSITVEKINVEPVLQKIASSYADKLAGLDDEYLSGRACL